MLRFFAVKPYKIKQFSAPSAVKSSYIHSIAGHSDLLHFCFLTLCIMKNLFLVASLLISLFANAQDCEPCGERTLVNFQQIEWLGIQKPEDSVLLNEWSKLEDLWHLVTQRCETFFKDGSCLFIKQTFRESQSAGIQKNNKYTLYGTILPGASDYVLQLFMHPACSKEIVAQTEIHFQIYPFFDLDKIATQAANDLVPKLQNIYDFEQKQRRTKNYGFGGDLSGGHIEITMDKTLVKGEETQVELRVVDCDGELLKNRDISTAGTIGGIFTPAKFKTNSEGKATVKFKMLTNKTAFVKVSSEIKNVWGCDDLYTGTEAIKGLEGAPVKVTISYNQYETKIMRRATLPGVKIKGGDETEVTDMWHQTVLYYFPSKKDLEEGMLVNAEKEGSNLDLAEQQSDPNASAVYVTETGYYIFSKNVDDAKIVGMIGNIEAVQGVEKGSWEEQYGVADLKHPSEVMFSLGNKNEPPSFMWIVQYPANGENIASGGATIVKGEDGVKWIVNKISDPKSIYKTEYILSLTLDAATELKKGNKAMKELFGFDSNELSKKLDPTSPQSNLFGASGTQEIKVRILSPYPAK